MKHCHFQFEWLYPDAAGLQRMRARLKVLLTQPDPKLKRYYITSGLLQVPDVAQAVSVDELLAALEIRGHSRSSCPCIWEYLRVRAASDANQGVPRPECLRVWEAIAKVRDYGDAKEADRMVAAYKAMIAEDAAWKEPDANALAKMQPAQKVNYWMHHLRDADARAAPSPWGSTPCRVVGTRAEPASPGKRKPNPAEELLKLGTAAMPEVIAHLDDTRPTRCQGQCYAGEENQVLLCYGDCCKQIFEELTGRELSEPDQIYPIKDGQAEACKALAERWWQGCQKKGEVQMLIEGVEAADRNSVELARRLISKSPADALKAIGVAVRRTKEDWLRASLLQCADVLPEDQPVQLLREQMDAPGLSSRVAAARALIRRGKAEGVRTIVNQWQSVGWEHSEWFGDRFSLEELIECMARCGDPAALRALAKGFPDRPPSIRFAIVKSLQGAEKDLQGRPLTPAVQEEIEGLLAGALGDHEPWDDALESADGKNAIMPVLGDMAALAVIGIWKKPASFDLYAPLEARENSGWS